MQTTEAMKQRLIDIILEKSFKYSEDPLFTLASGKKSAFYFNCKPTTLNPEGMNLIGSLLADMLADADVTAAGGLTLGADPLANALAVISFQKGKPIKAFIVRKDAKEHGTQRYTEGYYGMPGSRVIIVDDVCTTGESTMKAIERAEQVGYVVTAVMCLIDREQGGAERLKRYNFIPLISSRELLSDPKIQEALEQAGDTERT
jgi:orotate phosphoribosyltransferase